MARVFPFTLHFYNFISVDMVALSLVVDKECRQLKTVASGVKVDINFTFALREGNSFVTNVRKLKHKAYAYQT